MLHRRAMLSSQGKRITAVAVSALVGMTAPVVLTGRQPYVLTAWADTETSVSAMVSQLEAALALVESDFSGNAAAIGIVIGQVMAQCETESALYQTLQSAKILADAGGDNAASVKILLEQAIGLLTVEDTDVESDTQAQDTGESAAQDENTEASGNEMEDQEPASEVHAAEAQTDVAEKQDEAAQDETSQSDASETQDAAQTDTAETQDGIPQTEMETVGQAVSSPQREAADTLPAYEVLRYLLKDLNASVAVQVPVDWGSSASDSELTSYSPANQSGAINVSSGTLNTSYCVMPASDMAVSFEEFEANIEKMSIVSDVSSAEISAAGCSARRISYTMTLGSNVFYCETVCLAYGDNLYWVQILQGNKSEYDYFPVFDAVVASLDTDEQTVKTAQTGDMIVQDEAAETEASQPEQTESETSQPEQTESETSQPEQTESETSQPEQTESETSQPEQTESETSQPEQTESETSQPEQTESETAGADETADQAESSQEPIPVGGVTEQSTDLASFTYTVNGVTYQFPTAVSALTAGGIPIDEAAVLPAVRRGDASDVDEALQATQFYHYSTDIYMELVGITNLTGAETYASEGVITELVDTQGNDLDLTLPGNVRVGEPVINLITSFPEFMDVSLDGEASYRDEDTIYAANYREDGCYGYVIIKGNTPYYSALSIVCDNGTIREISMECLGAAQMAGFFE